jgi:hypothetical protein
MFQIMIEKICPTPWGESMKKKANHAKVEILSKDCIFRMANFYWLILHFSHNF